jgi:hypothetical protein
MTQCINPLGKYSLEVRNIKILKMKIKKYINRIKKPVSRVFKGRSEVAKKKLRFRGKFIKKCDLNTRQLFQVIQDTTVS